ncbi:MAG: DUF664 domain-containing protein [Chloroflexi bacterium]|nr:MAG: DUF664 domain-containing protein [Chloroflexota bacterium]
MSALGRKVTVDEADGAAIERRLHRVGRFVRLARALEAGGFYNGSKVLRAGADRELTIVAAPAAQLAHDEVAAEIDELAGDLAAAGYPSWFGRQLGVTAAAVRADESIPFQSAPPAWSCRVCGELFLDIPPTTCPTCEAPAIGFRNHEAVWYLELSDRSSTVDALAHGPSQIGRVLQGRTDEQLDRRPRPAEWSARETLEHITGAEELLSARIRRMLDEEDPELVAWQPGEAPPPSDEATHHRPDAGAQELFEHYRRLRLANVAVLRGLDAASWQRTGRHPEWGPVTVLSQASYFARHQAAHQAQLAAAVEGRVPGEPRPVGA